MIGVLTLIGALLYRWRGMAHEYKKYFPRPFNQIAFALPFAAAVYFYYAPIAGDWAWFIAFISLILTTLGILTGHGRGMDLGETDKGEPETIEFLIAWAKPRMSLYYYDALLMSVKGLCMTLPAGLLTLNPVLALSGALVGVCYAVAKFTFPIERVEAGELLTGAVLWAVVWSYLI